MPIQPHPITITLFAQDNTTKKSGSKVYLRNTTKKTTSSEETTNANGVAIIDLANLGLGDGQSVEYSTGDKILIIAYGPDGNENCHAAAMYTVTGEDKDQTLYLTPTQHTGGDSTVRLMKLFAFNGESTAYYIKVYSITDGALLAYIKVLATNSKEPEFSHMGIACNGGFVIEREHQGLTVTAIIK